jgi:formylglycine-generating enzyme required for sulfatase activity
MMNRLPNRCLLCLVPCLMMAAALPLRGQKAGKEVKLAKEVTNSIGMQLVLVPPGKFLMGSPKSEKERHNDEAEHEVEITRPFYLGAFEVTQAQYQKVMGTNPSYFSATGGGKKKVKGLDTSNFPVERVSWKDAVEFCKRLSALPKEKAAGRVYHLPTEAEWEYACRGGPVSSRAPFHFKKPSDSLSFGQANFNGVPYGGGTKGKLLNQTRPVGSYEPNRLGLYDLHGNVEEWCADAYAKGYYATSPKRDPKGPDAGPDAERVDRVLRGGTWSDPGRYCRAACRSFSRTGVRVNVTGFRVVLRPGAKTP